VELMANSSFSADAHKCRCRAVCARGLTPIALPSALAVCQYEGESNVYLFHCAEDWSVLGAAHFESLQSALASAEHGFPGVMIM
jgi:hypothetical protein